MRSERSLSLSLSLASLLVFAIAIALSGCHLLFPFDPGGPPADAVVHPQDGELPHDARVDGLKKDAPQPLDSTSDDAPAKLDTSPPAPDATISPDLPCSKQPEICNGADDNCNGEVDEGLIRLCYTGSSGCAKNVAGYTCEGICKAGSQTCNSGIWSSCSGQVFPQAEICNNLDDNCNGTKDEGLTLQCYTGPSGCIKSGGSYICDGLCNAGMLTCAAGKWGICLGENTPKTETCNNKDDDCDGQTDENAPCSIITQICKYGVCQ